MPGLWAFFWLPSQDTRWLVALQTRILVAHGVDGRDALRLIGGLLVVRFARLGRTARDHCAGRLIDQQEVLVGMGRLRAAGVLTVLGGLARAVTAACGPIDGHIRCPFPRQRVPRHASGSAFGLHTTVGARLVQDGEQTVHPGVGVGLTQVQRSCMHGLERRRRLGDENAQEFVRHAR